MKINVKGLAFVGFAAAILSANAMAATGDEKIVTSKAYVDSTFQPKGSYEVTANKETSKETLTTNKSSTTNYPSNKAITDYVDDMVSGGISNNAQGKSTANYQMGGSNGTWKTVETDGYVTVAQGTTTDDVKISIDSKVTNAGAALAATGTTAGNLTTEKAVVEYVGAQNYVTAADQVQANWNEANSNSKAYIQNKPTSLSAFTNDSGYITSSDVPAQVQADWAQETTTATDFIKNKPSLATVATSGSYNDLSNKPTALSDFTNDVVNDGTLTITVDGTPTTFTANSSTAASVSVSVPVKAVSLNGANVAPDASGNVALTNVESTTNKAAAITTGVGGNFDSTTAYATTKAVYDYVSALPGSTAIPATCTDATPCAFVATSSGAAWIQMAQN